MTKIVPCALLILLAGVKLGDWMMPNPEASPPSDVSPPPNAGPSTTGDITPARGAELPSATSASNNALGDAPATITGGAPAPRLWLITNAGIAVSPQRALPGHTIGLLYSSWCPAVRSSLSRFLRAIKPLTWQRHIVGLFANGELSQLLDTPDWLESEGISRTKQAELRRLLDSRGLGTGLVENDYAYPVDQSYPRFRVPRAQWEALGGRPGVLRVACFLNGVRESCPEELSAYE